MLEEIKKERSNYELTTNSKEKELIIQSLKIKDAHIQSYLANLTNAEERKRLIDLLKSKIKKLRETLSTGNGKNNEEELQLKFFYYEKLNTYLDCLNKKKSYIDIDLVSLNNLYERLLLESINTDARKIITINNTIIDYEKLSDIVFFSERKDINTYTLMKKEIDEISDYLNSRIRALSSLTSISKNIETIELYKILLDKYFELERKDKNIQKEIKDFMTKYSKKHIFSKKKKEELLEERQNLEDRSAIIHKEINKTIIYLELVINEIANKKLSYLLMNNKRIVFALDYMPYCENPFVANNLDVTFKQAMNSTDPFDLQYFIISNLHNINENNIQDIINYLKELIKRYKNVLENRKNQLDSFKEDMFLDEKEVVMNDSLIKFIYDLNNQVDTNGIKLIDYVKILLNIKHYDITFDDVIDIINYPNSLTYLPKIKETKAKVLEK